MANSIFKTSGVNYGKKHHHKSHHHHSSSSRKIVSLEYVPEIMPISAAQFNGFKVSDIPVSTEVANVNPEPVVNMMSDPNYLKNVLYGIMTDVYEKGKMVGEKKSDGTYTFKNKDKQPKKQPEQKQVSVKHDSNDKKPEYHVEDKKNRPNKNVEEVAETIKKTVSAVKTEQAVAAHNVGFNIGNFIKDDSNQQPGTMNPNPVLRQSVPQSNPKPMPFDYPPAYASWSQYQKAAWISQLINSNPTVPIPYDPAPQLDLNAKVSELQKHIEFIKGAHSGNNALSIIQINTLLGLIVNPFLKNKMNEFGAAVKPSALKMYEIKLEDVDTSGKFDIAFEIKLKDKKASMYVLFNTVPVFDPNTKTWNSVLSIEKR